MNFRFFFRSALVLIVFGFSLLAISNPAKKSPAAGSVRFFYYFMNRSMNSFGEIAKHEAALESSAKRVQITKRMRDIQKIQYSKGYGSLDRYEQSKSDFLIAKIDFKLAVLRLNRENKIQKVQDNLVEHALDSKINIHKNRSDLYQIWKDRCRELKIISDLNRELGIYLQNKFERYTKLENENISVELRVLEAQQELIRSRSIQIAYKKQWKKCENSLDRVSTWAR